MLTIASEREEEHLSDFAGDVLLHLLMADIRRFTCSAFDDGDADVVQRCPSIVAEGLRDGDEYVLNAVAVSFVEDTGWWDPGKSAFIESWPAPLRAEVERQRRWRPGDA